MITFTVMFVLGVVLLAVVVQLAKSEPLPARSAAAAAAPAPVPPATPDPADARLGDVISITGAADDLSDLDFTADRCTWFQAGARRWFELSGLYRESRAAMRVAGGDDAAVFLESGARLSLDGLGLSEDDLAQMDGRQNPADSFVFDGKSWMYRVSREAQAKPSDQPEPIGFYYWEFQEQDGKRLIAIQKFEGEPFAVTLYQRVHPGNVTIYRGGRG